jgi:hypothetical protein
VVVLRFIRTLHNAGALTFTLEPSEIEALNDATLAWRL